MHKNIFYAGLLLTVMLGACNKTRFLDAKPDNSLIVPATVADLQLILDYDLIMNGEYYGLNPDFLEAAADNRYIPDGVFESTGNEYTRNVYTWADKPYPAQTLPAWNNAYTCIFYANTVLDKLPSLSQYQAQADWQRAKGSALFYRAHGFYLLAQAFAPAYDKATASTDLGLPLRATADVNEKLVRATVQQTYDRILTDLKTAAPLLPAKPLYPTRPSQAACYALLARTYQTMEIYDSALVYAGACLSIQNSLMDYNDYPAGGYPFPLFNPEVIFHCVAVGTGVGYGNIDTTLLGSYAVNDLRPSRFFDTTLSTDKFVGSYDASPSIFGGLTTDEMFLVRAECYARANNVPAAMQDLNTLLVKRWKTGSFMPYTAVSAADALGQVLAERRKELCFRALRWTDIRRLNKEGANISLRRVLKGQTYVLAPNAPKWVWPIPDDVISFNPAIQQNPR